MERVAGHMAGGLNARGHRVLLVGPYSKAPALRAQIGERVELVEHRPSSTVAGLMETGRFLKDVARRERADVISAHGSVFPLLSGATPVVWTEHAIRYPNGKMISGAKGMLWRLVRRRLETRRWEAVGVSRFVLDSLRTELGLSAGVGRVIYNALPQAAELRALPLPKMTPPYQIGYLGRLEPEKRPQDVFELSRLVEAMGVPCEWRIFGGGSMAAEMTARAKQEGGGRIHVHGYVKDVREAVENVDLLFLSSHSEGLPTVVLEARLARRPVVGWRTAGVPEAAGEEGFLVDPPFELPRFAETIVRALQSGIPAAPPSGNFEFDRMMERYEEAFRSVLAGPAEQPARSRAIAPENAE
jgi:glycosyltransferase involved in cell wall biosynthesis